MPPRPAETSATPDHLVLTAERLIARHGVDGASMRQIAVDAGLRNPSSVQYHFGSKEALLRAVIELRLPGLNGRRLELLDRLDAEGRGRDLRALVDAMVRPLAELGPDCHYVEFLLRVGDREDFADAYISTGRLGHSMAVLEARLEEALVDLAPAIRASRVRLASTLMLAGLGRHRARVAREEPEPLSHDAFLVDLVDAITGLLSAPGSGAS